MKKLTTCLTIVAALAMVGSAAAVTVDGVLNTGEWDGFIYSDPVDNSPGYVEMVNWGAKVEGNYLYWFCELADGTTFWEDLRGYTSGECKAYPGLWIDVDHSDSTWISDDETTHTTNPADGKKEWALNHRGIDVNLECGIKGDWVNGANTQAYGSAFNYWGLYDYVDNVTVPVSDGSWYTAGSVFEARILLSELEGVVETQFQDGTPCDPTVWKVGMAIQGTNRSVGTPPIDYGYDVSLPRPIGISGDYVYGDTDLDGTVGLSDLNTLKGNWQATLAATDLGWALGDFDGDLSVGLSDLNALKAAWQQSYTGGGAVTPEPATLGLLALGVLGLLRRR